MCSFAVEQHINAKTHMLQHSMHAWSVRGFFPRFSHVPTFMLFGSHKRSPNQERKHLQQHSFRNWAPEFPVGLDSDPRRAPMAAHWGVLEKAKSAFQAALPALLLCTRRAIHAAPSQSPAPTSISQKKAIHIPSDSPLHSTQIISHHVSETVKPFQSVRKRHIRKVPGCAVL